MPKTPNPDSPSVTVDDARELLNQQVRVRGIFAGGDYAYDGLLVKVTDGDKPAIEIRGTEDQEFTRYKSIAYPAEADTNEAKDAYRESLREAGQHVIFANGQYHVAETYRKVVKAAVPLRSVHLLIDGETAAQIDGAAQSGG